MIHSSLNVLKYNAAFHGVVNKWRKQVLTEKLMLAYSVSKFYVEYKNTWDLN